MPRLSIAARSMKQAATRPDLERPKGGRDIGYRHLEKLHNLEILPPTGFTIACFPMKISAASARWTRAVEIFEA